MSRFLATMLAVSMTFCGFSGDSALAAPTGLAKPVLDATPANIEAVVYRHHVKRHRHYRHYRHYRRRFHHRGDAAATALFGSIVGGILSNPCTFGDCGYYYDDGGYYDGGYGGYGGYGYDGGYGGGGWGHRGGWGHGGHFHRGGFHGGGFHGGGFHGGGFHGGGHGGHR